MPMKAARQGRCRRNSRLSCSVCGHAKMLRIVPCSDEYWYLVHLVGSRPLHIAACEAGVHGRGRAGCCRGGPARARCCSKNLLLRQLRLAASSSCHHLRRGVAAWGVRTWREAGYGGGRGSDGVRWCSAPAGGGGGGEGCAARHGDAGGCPAAHLDFTGRLMNAIAGQ